MPSLSKYWQLTKERLFGYTLNQKSTLLLLLIYVSVPLYALIWNVESVQSWFLMSEDKLYTTYVTLFAISLLIFLFINIFVKSSAREKEKNMADKDLTVSMGENLQRRHYLAAYLIAIVMAVVIYQINVERSNTTLNVFYFIGIMIIPMSLHGIIEFNLWLWEYVKINLPIVISFLRRGWARYSEKWQKIQKKQLKGKDSRAKSLSR